MISSTPRKLFSRRAGFAAAMRKVVREVTGREPTVAEATRWAELAEVTVEAARGYQGAGRVKVTDAEIVYVHVDKNNRPLALGTGVEEGDQAPNAS